MINRQKHHAPFHKLSFRYAARKIYLPEYGAGSWQKLQTALSPSLAERASTQWDRQAPPVYKCALLRFPTKGMAKRRPPHLPPLLCSAQ